MKGTLRIIKDRVGNDYLAVELHPLKMLMAVTRFKSAVTDFEKLQENKFARDGAFKWHMTVVNAAEFSKFARNDMQSLDGKVVAFNMNGIGSASRSENITYFVVCASTDLDGLRADLGLPPHDFHITLGFDKKDVFGVPKDESSIILSFK